MALNMAKATGAAAISAKRHQRGGGNNKHLKQQQQRKQHRNIWRNGVAMYVVALAANIDISENKQRRLIKRASWQKYRGEEA